MAVWWWWWWRQQWKLNGSSKTCYAIFSLFFQFISKNIWWLNRILSETMKLDGLIFFGGNFNLISMKRAYKFLTSDHIIIKSRKMKIETTTSDWCCWWFCFKTGAEKMQYIVYDSEMFSTGMSVFFYYGGVACTECCFFGHFIAANSN